MTNAAVMLAKNFDAKRVEWPVYVSEKIDGVACKFHWADNENGMPHVVCTSRQGKPILSVQHLCDTVEQHTEPGDIIYGELHLPGQGFAASSGAVRRKTNQPDLQCGIWDAAMNANYNMYKAAFSTRLECLHDADILRHLNKMFLIPQVRCSNMQEVVDAEKAVFANSTFDNCEGIMLRALFGQVSILQEGKRSWGMQRRKPEGDSDLRVVSVEEAIDKHGNPKGMVGRVNVMYRGEVIGIGPGKLNHAQRILYWNSPNLLVGKIVQVQYKPDPNYDALREGRFIRIRDDKEVPDAD